MKKSILLIAALCVALVAGAQNRDALLSKISKAEAAAQDAKKAVKVTTWTALGDACLAGYQSIRGEAWLGAKQTEVKLLMSSQPVSSENVTLNGGSQFVVDHYADKDLYYSANGLEFINITKPLTDYDILAKAIDAYLKAAEIDVKNSKKSDIVKALGNIREAYQNDGWAAYFLGDMAKAADCFEKSIRATDNPVVAGKDSIAIYYTGALRNAAGDKAAAKKFYQECVSIGFDQDGNAHSSLAEILKNEGDVEGAKDVLNKGFQAYPTSQSILISLINIYLETKDDPNKILELIHAAQANEPGNASLFYAEANVYKQLGDRAKAEELYYKSNEVDPAYFFGLYELGNMYYSDAVEYQKQMNELDINDYKGYDALKEKFDQALICCLAPFEKVFNNCEKEEFKQAVAQPLKQAYFILRSKGAEYQEGYDKYNTYLGE